MLQNLIRLTWMFGAAILLAAQNAAPVANAPNAAPMTNAPNAASTGNAPPGAKAPEKPRAVSTTPMHRANSLVKLGGLFTMGLGETGGDLEDSAKASGKLSDANRDWLAENCEVVALDATSITPDTFPAMTKLQPTITPLLYVYASSLYEQDGHRGNVGGWKPEMSAWVLRHQNGRGVAHPDPGGHWMDFGNPAWAEHWRGQAAKLVRQYQAQGVIAAELPPGNTFVGANLAAYKTPRDRADATLNWLRAARAENQFLIIPSALGFEELAGHPTLPVATGGDAPELAGRLWDDYSPWIDGAWAEGWLRPYWLPASVRERLWEIQMEAAERAARSGQVFIAATAYRNDAELEFGLASYLLAWHRQGRLVFQPMPQATGQPADRGFSLAVTRREVEAKAAYFNAPLGAANQERHLTPAVGGMVWRRSFQTGVVYVNADDQRTVTVALGGPMTRVTGQKARKLKLPPHSGVILLYPPPAKKP